jgi:hypothetical protein
MRKVIVCNMISLDGYYAGRDGDLTVLPMNLVHRHVERRNVCGGMARYGQPKGGSGRKADGARSCSRFLRRAVCAGGAVPEAGSTLSFRRRIE